MGSVSEAVRQCALQRWIDPARRRGQDQVRVNVGEVERALGLRGRTPTVAYALRANKFLNGNQLAIIKTEGPPSLQSPTVTYTYRLSSAPTVADDSWFANLRGLFSGLFDADGGGEAWLRAERKNFGGSESQP